MKFLDDLLDKAQQETDKTKRKLKMALSGFADYCVATYDEILDRHQDIGNDINAEDGDDNDYNLGTTGGSLAQVVASQAAHKVSKPLFYVIAADSLARLVNFATRKEMVGLVGTAREGVDLAKDKLSGVGIGGDDDDPSFYAVEMEDEEDTGDIF